MPAHMLGPWHVQGEFEGVGGHVDIMTVNGSSVCSLTPAVGIWEPDEIANAYLIAAAPDLLEALKAMMHYDTTAAMMSLPIGKQMRDIYSQARAAIAKAEGTSPGRANHSSDPAQPTEAK
jgi:hypothetical protein